MNTKVFTVTGVTSGMGKAIALELAKTGGTASMVARVAEEIVRMATAHASDREAQHSLWEISERLTDASQISSTQ